MKLNIKSFALTCGIVWGVCMFIFTWWMIVFGDGAVGEKVPIVSDMYIMYRINPAGSIVGLLWGFLDGAIGGLVFAWLYNLLTGKMQKGEI